MSIEHDFNLKIGEKKQLKNITINFKKLDSFEEKNYQKIVGEIEVINAQEKTTEVLKPEIRVYNQPETITYEASIKSNILSDTYVTMSNISKENIYNIKFQKKPFMNMIWLSTILIVLGGSFRILTRKSL